MKKASNKDASSKKTNVVTPAKSGKPVPAKGKKEEAKKPAVAELKKEEFKVIIEETNLNSNSNTEFMNNKLEDIPNIGCGSTLLPLTERETEETDREMTRDQNRVPTDITNKETIKEAMMKETKSKESFKPFHKAGVSEVPEDNLPQKGEAQLGKLVLSASPRRHSMVVGNITNALTKISREQSKDPVAKDPFNSLNENSKTLEKGPSNSSNNFNTASDFIPPDVGGTMQIRVISRFRPLNSTERVNNIFNF